MWMSAGGLPAWIQYTFDKEYKLHELWVWNANTVIESLPRLRGQERHGRILHGRPAWTREGVPEFAQATGMATYTANTTVDLGGVTARYVKLTINTAGAA